MPRRGMKGTEYGTSRADGDELSIRIEGMDKLWTRNSRLDIPLAHGADVDQSIVRGWKGWRGPGTHIPGVIVAGTFHHDGDRVFWDVHDPATRSRAAPG